MKSVIYAAILLAVCIARASALECYACDECVLSGALALAENSETCSTDIFTRQDYCSKTVTNGVVYRRCATSLECAVTSLVAECKSGSDQNCQICCSTDKCNGAVATKVSFVGLALALATAVFSRI